MKYIIGTTKGYRLQFGLLFLAVIFSTITGALFPSAIGKIVDQIFYVRQMKGFLVHFFIYAGLYLLNQFFHGMLNFVWAHLEITYIVDIRKKCFIHLMKLKASVWTKIKSGDVMHRIMDDTNYYLEFIHRSLFYVMANLVQLLISIGYMLYANFVLGLIAIFMTPIMAYSIRFFAARLKKKYQDIQEQKGFLDAWILEMMVGISEWILLNGQKKVQLSYRNKTLNLIDKEVRTGYLNIVSAGVTEVLTLIGQLCIYLVAAISIGKNNMTVGQFVACAAYFSTCATYYNALGKKITDISANLVGIRRVEEFMSWEEEQDQLGAEDIEIKKGCIRFENVSFSYEKEKVLKNVSLNIGAGEKIALVGKSGEGKSTLLQMIYRLYEPDDGEIYIDDKRSIAYTYASLRSQVAVVQQDNGLIHGTIRKNIILSEDNSMDKRIWHILEGLQLKEKIKELPDGLDTVIDNSMFSGGQRQRIAIARCIFREPKILLLDEATSALDEKTERLVNEFIYNELPSATIISIAHRFSSVLMAEKIVVIEQGNIVDTGRHDVLVQTNELYYSLFREFKNSIQDEGDKR